MMETSRITLRHVSKTSICPEGAYVAREGIDLHIQADSHQDASGCVLVMKAKALSPTI